MSEYHSLKEFLPNNKEESSEITAEFQEEFGKTIAAILVGAFNAHKNTIDVKNVVYSNLNI